MTQEKKHDCLGSLEKVSNHSNVDVLKNQKSAVDQKLCFDEQYWIVSVLNTKEKEFGGHSVILVEGIENGDLFVGRYDVFAATNEQASEEDLLGRNSFFSTINKKGYIANVRMEENNHYDRIACQVVLISNTKEDVPVGISKNEVILQKVNDITTAYWLSGSRIHKKSVSIQVLEQKNNLKFPELNEGRYLIRPTDNESLVKEITALCGYQHPDGAAFYGQCQSRSFTQSVEKVKKMIESIRADKIRIKNAHLGEDTYIKYQYVGSENSHGLLKLFSESGGGINCAEWCLEKLKVAEIHFVAKPIPSQVAGNVCKLF